MALTDEAVRIDFAAAARRAVVTLADGRTARLWGVNRYSGRATVTLASGAFLRVACTDIVAVAPEVAA